MARLLFRFLKIFHDKFEYTNILIELINELKNIYKINKYWGTFQKCFNPCYIRRDRKEIKSNRIKKEIETGDICLVKPKSWTKIKPDPKPSLPSIVIIRQINNKSCFCEYLDSNIFTAQTYVPFPNKIGKDTKCIKKKYLTILAENGYNSNVLYNINIKNVKIK